MLPLPKRLRNPLWLPIIYVSDDMAVLGLGTDGADARLLARVTGKSWQLLGLAVGADVHVQVKAVALT